GGAACGRRGPGLRARARGTAWAAGCSCRTRSRRPPPRPGGRGWPRAAPRGGRRRAGRGSGGSGAPGAGAPGGAGRSSGRTEAASPREPLRRGGHLGPQPHPGLDPLWADVAVLDDQRDRAPRLAGVLAVAEVALLAELVEVGEGRVDRLLVGGQPDLADPGRVDDDAPARQDVELAVGGGVAALAVPVADSADEGHLLAGQLVHEPALAGTGLAEEDAGGAGGPPARPGAAAAGPAGGAEHVGPGGGRGPRP